MKRVALTFSQLTCNNWLHLIMVFTWRVGQLTRNRLTRNQPTRNRRLQLPPNRRLHRVGTPHRHRRARKRRGKLKGGPTCPAFLWTLRLNRLPRSQMTCNRLEWNQLTRHRLGCNHLTLCQLTRNQLINGREGRPWVLLTRRLRPRRLVLTTCPVDD